MFKKIIIKEGALKDDPEEHLMLPCAANIYTLSQLNSTCSYFYNDSSKLRGQILKIRILLSTSRGFRKSKYNIPSVGF